MDFFLSIPVIRVILVQLSLVWLHKRSWMDEKARFPHLSKTLSDDCPER
jgi:hypothetical protein